MIALEISRTKLAIPTPVHSFRNATGSEDKAAIITMAASEHRLVSHSLGLLSSAAKRSMHPDEQ